MTEPAKDEAELIEWIRQAIWHHGDGREDAEATLAAIRAAGWAVVPQEPTNEMLWAARSADWDAPPERLTWADGYRLMLAAAPGVKP